MFNKSSLPVYFTYAGCLRKARNWFRRRRSRGATVPARCPPMPAALVSVGRMDGLTIAPGPGAPEGLLVPNSDLNEQFTRSSGPGGQKVNTSDSKVQLRLDIAAAAAFTEPQCRRLLRTLASRLDGTTLTVSVSTHRTQVRNRSEARDRMARILRTALAPAPPPRKKTKPTKGSVRRRLDAKRRRSQVKSARRRPEEG